MKKVLINYGGLLLFYGVIVLGIILINIRFNYLNDKQESSEVVYAFNN